jgi:alpha-tubulin suppressor-like RCC1 family protein
MTAARFASGDFFSLAVTAAGVPYTWGLASTLGDASATDRPTAAAMGTLNAVRFVAGGIIAALAVRTDGTLWAWGYRGSIDCMFGGTAPIPYQITGAANPASLSMGVAHTLLLGGDGVVRAFGCNDAGQLGRSGFAPAATPVVVAGLPANIVAVAAGGNFSLALDGAGNVWSWGRGALGDGTALLTSRYTPTQIPGLANVVAVAAGGEHALAVRSDGSVWAWGSNTNGKLGDGSEVNRLTPVATLLSSQATTVSAGDQNSLALKSDGTVWSWGINETGQLGSGSLSPGYRPQPAPVTGLTGVVAIDFGAGGGLGHAMAQKADGTLWSWGWNSNGQLGDGRIGPSTFATSPVQVTGLNLN